MPPRRKTARGAPTADTPPSSPPKRKRGRGTPAPAPAKKAQARARGATRARAASTSSEDESSASGEGSTQLFRRHDELAAEAGEDSDDEDSDDFRGDTLAYLAQVSAATDAKIAEINAGTDFEEAIHARLESMRPAPVNPDILKLFHLRIKMLDDVADIVADARVQSHVPLLEAFNDAYAYFGEIRPGMVASAREDAEELLAVAAERAEDPNTLKEAKDMVKALRRTLRKRRH